MNPRTEKILLFLVFIFCLSLRLAFISQKNLWFDEVYSWHLSMDSFYEIIVRTSNDIHPPLYYFVLKIWNFVCGDSVASMRLLSALFTSSAVFFIYPISKRLMDPTHAFLVVILYAVSPLNLYYSQEVRMAAMNLFLNITSVYFLLKLTDKPHDYHKIFKEKYAIPFILFTVAALYTHYFSFFILAAELLYILYVNRKNPKQYIAYLYITAVMLIIYSIWIPELLVHFSRGQYWRAPQTTMQVLTEYVNYVRGLNLGLYYYYAIYESVKYFTYFIAVVLLTSFAGIILIRNKNVNNSLVLVLLVLFVPLILAGIISFKQRVEFYRYLSILVPYISIIVVYGISKWNNKFISYGLLGCLMAVNVYGMNIHYSFNFKNDDYRELIQQINTDYKRGDRIYVEPHYNGWAISYYGKHPADKKQLDLKLPDPVYIRYGWNEILDSINTQKPERFWVILDYSAVDTSQYQVYISGLEKNYTQDFKITYYLTPTKVELYRFKRQ